MKETEQIGLLLRELIHRALSRGFVGPPPKQFGAVAESIASDMIVTDFDHERRLERAPDVLFALIPAAGSAWSGASKARRFDEFFEPFCDDAVQSCRGLGEPLLASARLGVAGDKRTLPSA